MIQKLLTNKFYAASAITFALFLVVVFWPRLRLLVFKRGSIPGDDRADTVGNNQGNNNPAE